MSNRRHRPLPLEQLRAFDAVARHLSFSAAAEDLHLTQSAVSRQIKALEDELGASLFQRGTRRVALSADGHTLLLAVGASLERIDAAVRQIRQAKGRRSVSLSTFASFASLWLIPKLHSFQQQHPDIDIRISAGDALVDLESADFDLVLRYCHPDEAPPGALRLFGEVLTPVVSAATQAQAAAGQTPPLRQAADLAQYTLLEEDDTRPSSQYLTWHRWLQVQGHAGLQPRRWLFMNFTYQQIQGALAGQGVALARLALVSDAIERGELVEPFGLAGRMQSPYSYWLVPAPNARDRAELRAFCAWVRAQAAQSRTAIGESE
ncbi:MAG TPA: LysR family transcriptional regulator [Rhizobacter sp.]|nr:LysR family transcriptional regulator [Rhizobacter sp.]